jgi:hypothetical protein
MPPGLAISAVEEAGLGFDHATGTGVVLHMLSGLAVDGRIGLTAIGRTPVEAAELHDGVGKVLVEAGQSGQLERSADRLAARKPAPPTARARPSRE